MWHISNEYGPTAYNEAASVNFRRWLKRKYGDIATLNEAWTTRFWGQVYTDWDQIEVPSIPRSWMNPSRILDFKRFTSDALMECFIAERDIVRSFRDDIPVMTNFMRFYRNADYWRWAPEEDAVALDIYPIPPTPTRTCRPRSSSTCSVRSRAVSRGCSWSRRRARSASGS